MDLIRPNPALKLLTTVDDVIDIAFGGTKTFGDITGKSEQSVSNYRAAGFFAPGIFLICTHELEKRGYRAPPALWRITALARAE